MQNRTVGIKSNKIVLLAQSSDNQQQHLYVLQHKFLFRHSSTV